MHSALPKVLQPLAGRPLLEHVIRAARALEPAGIHIVYGHGAEQVRAAFADQPDLTGRCRPSSSAPATRSCRRCPAFPTIIKCSCCCGDVPLIRRRDAASASSTTRPTGKLALLTALLDDATGYGRVLRNAGGDVTRIVEHKDASDAERRVNEINTGLIAFDAGPLRRYLAQLEEQQRAARVLPHRRHRDGVRATSIEVQGIVAESPTEVLGINDRAQLAAAERTWQQRQTADLMARGATLADPARIDVRGEVTARPRRVHRRRRRARRQGGARRPRARSDRTAVIANSTLGADTRVHAHSRAERRRGRRRLRDRTVRALAAGHRARGARQSRQLRRNQEQPDRRRTAR